MNAWRAALWMPGAYLAYTKSAFLSKSKHWNPKELDLNVQGKTFIVTVPATCPSYLTSAYAFEIYNELLSILQGGKVHLICRNKERGVSRNNYAHEQQSRPSDVKEWAKQWLDSGEKIDVLVNNAGVLLNKREKTPHGLDACFATNLLGTFLLTELLMPCLQKSAPSRVITVSSGGMYTAKLNADDLQFEKMKDWDGVEAYAQTKRAQVYLNEVWASKYTKDTGVHFYCMHPGWAETPGVQTSLPQFHDRFKDNLRTSEQGADTVVWLAIHPSVAKESGKFYFDREATSPHLSLGATHSSHEDVNKMYASLQQIAGLANKV